MKSALLLAFALPLQMAAQAQTADDGVAQKVEIIGSRISRTDGEMALPVQVIERRQILESGAQTTEELVADLTSNSAGFPEALSIGNDGKPGQASASLRGLGSTATLVLLNGRRLANYAFSDGGAAVDLHAIPLAAIERVEILKDGASALYGSDAVAGVINFVTRSDYRNGELTLDGGATRRGGAARTGEVLSVGFGDLATDGFNALGVFEHRRTGELQARQRSFSATSYRPEDGADATSLSSFPGNIPLGNGVFANPAAPKCTDFTVYKNGGCAYDPARQIDDLPPSQQTSAIGRATMRVAPDVDAYAEALYETDRIVYKIAAIPISAQATNGVVEIDVPTTSPFYPQGLGLTQDLVNVRYRTASLGPRTSASDSVNERGVVGVKGTALGWDFDGGVAISESHATFRFLSGYVGSNALASAFASGQIDPFGDSGPVGDALLASTQVKGEARSSQGVTQLVDFHASKGLYALPAGPLTMVAGGEWRHETLRDTEAALVGDVPGETFSPPTTGTRTVQALFLEFELPLAKGLDAQLAARRDHYSDFGNTVNPEASIAWRPGSTLLLRASAGTGFRAPTLPELYTAHTTDLVDPDVADKLRCPITHLDSDCAPEILNGTGGNSALKPIRSNQYGAGFVLAPVRSVDLSVDYWAIRLRHNIATLSPDEILADPSAFSQYITRGPVDPAFPGLPGPILRVDTYNLNLSRLSTSGFDFSAGYRSEPDVAGRFSVRLEGTLTTRSSAITYFGVEHSALGTDLNGIVVPRWRHQLSLGWERGPCTVTLSQSFSGGFTDENPLPDGSARRVGSTVRWDSQLAYDVTRRMTLRVGARNLFDRNPPYSNQNAYAQPGYEPTTSDPRGRFVYVTLTARVR